MSQREVTCSASPPPGSPYRWSGISIYRSNDGKVDEENSVSDLLDLLQQLGVIPEAPNPQAESGSTQ